MSKESFDEGSQELDIDKSDLKIGQAYAKRNAAWKIWYTEGRRGNTEIEQKMLDLMNSLQKEAKAEWLAAVLIKAGYSPDAKEVTLQPYETIGWGEEGSLAGGIPQQDINTGNTIQVKVNEIDWNTAVTGKSIYSVTVPIPDKGGKGLLVKNKK